MLGIIPNAAEFLNSQCADLTPYLSGDAVKAYPNLANLPTLSWKSTIYNGKIMGVPPPRSAPSSVMYVNRARYDQEIGNTLAQECRGLEEAATAADQSAGWQVGHRGGRSGFWLWRWLGLVPGHVRRAAHVARGARR